LRLQALADSPDAFGSTLAVERARTDDDWMHRLSGVDTQRNLPVLAEIGGTPVGLAWGRIDDSDLTTANVYQMWVAPLHRQLGAGQLLLEAIIEWAKARNIRQIVLTVTCGDTSAYRLYTRIGFKPIGAPIPLRPESSVSAQPMRLVLREDAA